MHACDSSEEQDTTTTTWVALSPGPLSTLLYRLRAVGPAPFFHVAANAEGVWRRGMSWWWLADYSAVQPTGL